MKKILVMDDNVNFLKLIKRLLEPLNFGVELATEGAEAIRIFQEEKKIGKDFELLLFDLIIEEGIGGIETIQIIRKLEPNIKAIAMSGDLPEEIMADPEKFGFDSFLGKPFKLNDLKDVIKKILE